MKVTAINHLTATERKYISMMLDAGLSEAKINRMSFAIKGSDVFKLYFGNYFNGTDHKWRKIATLA